jgi:hypothetical protein
MLGAMQVSMAFWAGDLMNYSEGLFGEEYTELFKDWNPHTLAEWKWVSKAVPLSRRRDGLSWSHHATVAKMDPNEQTKWLQEAETNKWTRGELRKAIMPPAASGKAQDGSESEDKGEGSLTGESTIVGQPEQPETITCPFCGKSWQL